MRKTALAGLFVCAIMATASHKASAETLEIFQIDELGGNFSQLVVMGPFNEESQEPIAEQPSTSEPVLIKHTVVESDSLSTIAAQHETTWKRLFDRNGTIEHPDIIKVGEELIIPRPEEQLPDRPLPLPPAQPAIAPRPNNSSSTRTTARQRPPSAPAAPRPRGATSGNRYSAGYCTWYAKSRRPDLPNNLGNANTWVARASAQGIPTGSAPRAGAIGQQGMHVVYVESVNSNGTVTISEMNFKGLYVISSRTVPASNFRYIY